MEDYRLPDGRVVKMVEQKWDALQEPWGEYAMEDGTFVRMKNIMVKMFRVLDEEGNPAFTADGDPHIVVRSTRVITAKRR